MASGGRARGEARGGELDAAGVIEGDAAQLAEELGDALRLVVRRVTADAGAQDGLSASETHQEAQAYQG